MFRVSIWWLVDVSITTSCVFCEGLKSKRRLKSKAGIKKHEDENNRSRGISSFQCSSLGITLLNSPTLESENLLSVELRVR